MHIKLLSMLTAITVHTVGTIKVHHYDDEPAGSGMLEQDR